MTDSERELHIKNCGELMQAAWQRYEESGCFDARGEADMWRVLMCAAIQGRSPEFVARMEKERGIF